MNNLSLEQLVAIHALLISETGGSDGIRDIGRLESAIASQTQEVFGEEIYKDVYEKAAAIIRSIVADHPLVDGNKQTAMLAGLTFMKINKVKVTLKTRELEDFAVKVATDHLSVEQIADWLRSHTQSAQKDD